MSRLKVVTVVGARPQFIKHAPVARAIAADGRIDNALVHTGQHFDDTMSAVFFEELGIPAPDVDLGVHGGSHAQMTGRMIEALEAVVTADLPDWILVYGDTNSTLAAAIVASKLPVRLAHVEAGLRSYNRSMPEEINRIVTDHLSHMCLTPTVTADANLLAEGLSGELVVRTGDVMFDAVRLFGAIASERSEVLPRAGVVADGFVLATIHRAENTDDRERLATVVAGLCELAQRVPVVLPLHPRTARAVASAGLSLGEVVVLPPVGYLDMLALEGGARCVVTDSGGVQKEAFFQRRPCVTLRAETEWVELVDLGWNHLVPPTGTDFVERLLRAVEAGGGADGDPYGDGTAARRVVSALVAA